MKRNFLVLVSVSLVVCFVSLGCASGKKAIAKEETSTAKNTNTAKTTSKTQKTNQTVAQASNPQQPAGQESAVTKSNMQDQEIDELMKKYSATAAKTATAPLKRVAPDFKLQDINFDMYSLSDYKGKQPVLLVFWIIQCDYCKSELQVLNGRYPKLVEDGLEVFAINVGDSINAVSAFIRDIGISLKVLADEVTSVASSYRTSGVPTFVLVNKDGNIVFQDNIFPEQYKALLSAQETPK